MDGWMDVWMDDFINPRGTKYMHLAFLFFLAYNYTEESAFLKNVIYHY